MDSLASTLRSLPLNEGCVRFPKNSKYSTPSKLKKYTDYDLKTTPKNSSPIKLKLARFCPYSLRPCRNNDQKPPSIPHNPLSYTFTSKPFPSMSLKSENSDNY